MIVGDRPALKIIYAAYGNWDVTSELQAHVGAEELICEVGTSLFGLKPNPTLVDQLLVVHQWGDESIRLALCGDNELLRITPENKRNHHAPVLLKEDGSLIFAVVENRLVSSEVADLFFDEAMRTAFLLKLRIDHAEAFHFFHFREDGTPIDLVHWNKFYRTLPVFKALAPEIHLALFQGQDVTAVLRRYSTTHPSILRLPIAGNFGLEGDPTREGYLVILYEGAAGPQWEVVYPGVFFSSTLLPPVSEKKPLVVADGAEIFKMYGPGIFSVDNPCFLNCVRWTSSSRKTGFFLRVHQSAGIRETAFWAPGDGMKALQTVLLKIHPEGQSFSLKKVLITDHVAIQEGKKSEAAISRFLRVNSKEVLQAELQAWVHDPGETLVYASFLIFSILRHAPHYGTDLCRVLLQAIPAETDYSDMLALVQRLIFTGLLDASLLPYARISPQQAQELVGVCLNPRVILDHPTLFADWLAALESAFWIAHYQGKDKLGREVAARLPGLAEVPPICLDGEGLIFDEGVMGRMYGKGYRSQADFREWRRQLTGLITYLVHYKGMSLEEAFTIVIKLRSDFAFLAREDVNQRVFFEKSVSLSTKIIGTSYAKYYPLAIERGACDSTGVGVIYFRGATLLQYGESTTKDPIWFHASDDFSRKQAFAMAQEILYVEQYIFKQPDSPEKNTAVFCLLAVFQWFLSFPCPFKGGNACAAEVLVQSVARVHLMQVSQNNDMPDCHSMTSLWPWAFVKIYAEITELKSIGSEALPILPPPDQLAHLMKHWLLNQLAFDKKPIQNFSAAAEALLNLIRHPEVVGPIPPPQSALIQHIEMEIYILFDLSTPLTLRCEVAWRSILDNGEVAFASSIKGVEWVDKAFSLLSATAPILNQLGLKTLVYLLKHKDYSVYRALAEHKEMFQSVLQFANYVGVDDCALCLQKIASDVLRWWITREKLRETVAVHLTALDPTQYEHPALCYLEIARRLHKTLRFFPECVQLFIDTSWPLAISKFTHPDFKALGQFLKENSYIAMGMPFCDFALRQAPAVVSSDALPRMERHSCFY
jgi:hypothetical protein